MTGHGTCEETGKVVFYSVAEAKKSLVGAMRSRRIRVYKCPANPGHYHMTKEGSRDLRNSG